MKKGKDIDSIYRERFKTAEITPPEGTWENILSQLPEEGKKSRTFPLWLKLTGAAAVLALIFTTSNIFHQEPTQPWVSKNAILNDNFFDGKINEASQAFHEKMHQASLLLENLSEETLHMKVAQQKTAPKNHSKMSFLGLIQDPEDLELPKITSHPQIVANGDSKTNEVEKIDTQEPLLTSEGKDIEEPEEKEREKRLFVSTKFAPVYFDNFGKGSTIDARFAQNEGTGEVSFSYGVNVAYQVSKNVKIRSGVSKVDLRYNTQDISFNDAVSSAAINGEPMKTMTLSSPEPGQLNQRLEFIEVPVEIEYALLQKKIGINLIGGGSALFLDKNLISLDAQNFTTKMGEAQNLNNLSFSTNIGLGVDYDISPQVQFNFEPVLKLQLNTFKDIPNVNPYFFGIYSGLSYKF